MKTLAFFTLFELAAACAWGTTLYEYQGNAFRMFDGVYGIGDHITGSVLLDDVPIPLSDVTTPITRMTGHVLDYTFTDGHQTFTPATSGFSEFDFLVSHADGRLLDTAPAIWDVVLTRPASADVPAGQLWTSFTGEGGDRVTFGSDLAFYCVSDAGCLAPQYNPRGTWTVTTPEPATLTLLGVGCIGLVLARRWRR